jgi:putative lipoprotein
MYRERIALPANAVFEATLEDVSRADAPSTIVGSFRKESPGNPPFQFAITYDPKQIIENHTYVVRAKVNVDGKLMFTSTERQQVLTHGHGSEIGVPIMLRMASGGNKTVHKPVAAVPDEPLTETYWKLVELQGKPVRAEEHQREASLVFHTKDSRIAGSGGCNRLMGGYAMEGSSLHFKGVASTMMACAHGMQTEQAFVAALNKIESWKISGKTLELYGKEEAPLARFEAVALK